MPNNDTRDIMAYSIHKPISISFSSTNSAERLVFHRHYRLIHVGTSLPGFFISNMESSMCLSVGQHSRIGFQTTDFLLCLLCSK